MKLDIGIGDMVGLENKLYKVISMGTGFCQRSISGQLI
jgi:hypothetical protein